MSSIHIQFDNTSSDTFENRKQLRILYNMYLCVEILYMYNVYSKKQKEIQQLTLFGS